jgi:hypothetical protein
MISKSTYALLFNSNVGSAALVAALDFVAVVCMQTNVGARLRSARHIIGDRMAAHRKSDQSRDDLCAGGFRKRALNSFHPPR